MRNKNHPLKYETKPYSIHNHSRIKGLGKLSPFYCDSWNSLVTNQLQDEGIDNMAWYDEFTASDYRPKKYEDVMHVFQFEQLHRMCHRCQKVKHDLWYVPIRNRDMTGTPEEATQGILKAIATNTFCAVCAPRVGL